MRYRTDEICPDKIKLLLTDFAKNNHLSLYYLYSDTTVGVQLLSKHKSKRRKNYFKAIRVGLARIESALDCIVIAAVIRHYTFFELTCQIPFIIIKDILISLYFFFCYLVPYQDLRNFGKKQLEYLWQKWKSKEVSQEIGKLTIPIELLNQSSQGLLSLLKQAKKELDNFDEIHLDKVNKGSE